MDTRKLFPSKYLKASDLEDGPRIFTIHHLVEEEVGQGKDAEEKPLLYFVDHDQALVLNITNLRTIEEGYGYESETWPGRELELFAMKVDFAGKRVDGVRVRVPKPPSADELTPSSSDGGPDDLDDEIPDF